MGEQPFSKILYKKLIGLAKSEIENSHPGIISKIFIFVKKRFVELLIGITITVISGLILASL
jgi:hypothetical protein